MTKKNENNAQSATTKENKQTARDRKIEEIGRIVTVREALRAESSQEELRAEIAVLERAILEGKQASMITELCKVQEDNPFLLKLRS